MFMDLWRIAMSRNVENTYNVQDYMKYRKKVLQIEDEKNVYLDSITLTMYT